MKQLLTLHNTLLPPSVFPTLVMLYCQVTPAPQLYIAPGADLHSDEAKCIGEIIDVLRNSGRYCGEVILELGLFDLPVGTRLVKVQLGEECLLYRI